MEKIAVKDSWCLYERAGKHNPPWKSFKLVVDSKSLRKKNFWLGWNVVEKRIARNHDAGYLSNKHPAIYNWVIKTLGIKT